MAKKKPPKPPETGLEPQPPRKPAGEPAPARRAAPKASKATAPTKSDSKSLMVQARTLIAQAAQALDPKKRVTLAREALKIHPDCSEAYLVLADYAKSRKEALDLHRQAVEAAERHLGPETFAQYDGQFWGFIETRPYMRARLGLAEALWASGRRAEAAEHLEAMLKLNPGDNQGLRYMLFAWLLYLDRLDDLDALLDRFEEDSASWTFTRTLVAFRKGGDSPEARKFLTKAKKANKHVLEYLLGRQSLPPEPPRMYSPGDESDAIIYVSQHLPSWKGSPGSLTWLRSKEKAPKKREPRAISWVGPSKDAEQRVRKLPSELDAWQADFRQFDRRIEVAGEMIRPWMILVSSRTHDFVLAHALTDQDPSPRQIWDVLEKAMMKPAAGEPHRPTEIQVRPGKQWDVLTGPLESIGVSCSPTEVLDQVDFLFDDLTRHMAGVDPPGMLDMPGVTPEQVGRFYESAANFYKRAPWRSLGYESVIRVECDRYQSGPWFAVIMGQSGLTLGLALYEDLALLRKMWAGKLSDEEGARKTVALTTTFDDDASVSEGDLLAINRNSWPVANSEAYPSLFRKERGLSMRPPLAWEIDLMDACLRVLPDFVARRKPDDLAKELVPVPGSQPPLELTLCWLEESY